MGLIEDVPYPRNPTAADLPVFSANWRKYSEEVQNTINSSREILKGYYDDLLDLKYAIAAYIISIDHCDESLDFSIKQFNESLDTLSSIEDENKEEREKRLSENIDICNDFKQLISDKREFFKKIDDYISIYIEKVITKNNNVAKAGGGQV